MSSKPAVHQLAREGQSNLLRIQLEDNPDLLLTVDTDSRTPLQNAVGAVPPAPTTVSTILDFLPQLEPEQRTKMLENQDEVGSTALISAGEL
ncbi:hypothetical protein BCR35DRAFT_308884 [Leucosporidium creatinivorum]|uniref:Uncharacterized protein n=1 Tax=Leucosporidium creatinivorum TaxID=106004 RepID=A0A1Y2DU88_9BASI|nr:hypothetical protein BCR35DRAFT_308884 [Leucosporidium creatinivorum]